jgi:hypothetical protein
MALWVAHPKSGRRSASRTGIFSSFSFSPFASLHIPSRHRRGGAVRRAIINTQQQMKWDGSPPVPPELVAWAVKAMQSSTYIPPVAVRLTSSDPPCLSFLQVPLRQWISRYVPVVVCSAWPLDAPNGPALRFACSRFFRPSKRCSFQSVCRPSPCAPPFSSRSFGFSAMYVPSIVVQHASFHSLPCHSRV